jgi:hypothetical protein
MFSPHAGHFHRDAIVIYRAQRLQRQGASSDADQLVDGPLQMIKLRLHLRDALELNRARVLKISDHLIAFIEHTNNALELGS